MSYVESNAYQRDTNYIDDRIVADPKHFDASQTPSGQGQGWRAEPGKYRLVASRACPWAHRAVITRRLMGLEDAISQGLTGPPTTGSRGLSTSPTTPSIRYLG